jgi:hypothetical protein
MIIAFTGKKRSGKSTAAAYVVSKIPGAVRLNFKTALLNEMRERFPNTLRALVRLVEGEHYNGMVPLTVETLLENKPDDVVRFFMQEYGTEVRRHDEVDYWVDRWVCAASKHTHVVVDDVRFINEAQAIKDMNGMVIRIVRDGQQSTDTHQSETEMDSIVPTYTIVAPDGHPEALQSFLDGIISRV